ncbi:MAG: MFS transporter, partial [Gaiellales bacterium]
MAAGLAYYGARGSLANFVISWQDAFDVSRGDVSLIVTASFLSMGLAQIVGGKLLERVSPWKVLAAGMVLGIAGYGLCAIAPEPGQRRLPGRHHRRVRRRAGRQLHADGDRRPAVHGAAGHAVRRRRQH